MNGILITGFVVGIVGSAFGLPSLIIPPLNFKRTLAAVGISFMSLVIFVVCTFTLYFQQ